MYIQTHKQPHTCNISPICIYSKGTYIHTYIYIMYIYEHTNSLIHVTYLQFVYILKVHTCTYIHAGLIDWVLKVVLIIGST